MQFDQSDNRNLQGSRSTALTSSDLVSIANVTCNGKKVTIMV